MSESTSDPDTAPPEGPPQRKAEPESEAETETEAETEVTGPTGTSFEIGDLVADREPANGNANTAVVVNCSPQPASEWAAYGDTTVAEDNPDYSEDALVIVIVYRSELDRFDSGWADRDDLDPYSLTDFNEAGLSYYSFPATRLKLLPAEEETATEETGRAEERASDGSSARMSQITRIRPPVPVGWQPTATPRRVPSRTTTMKGRQTRAKTNRANRLTLPSNCETGSKTAA